MGWSYQNREKGAEPVVETLARDLGEHVSIVESSVTLTVAYLAVLDHKSGETFAVVVLIDHRNGKSRNGFGYLEDEYYNFGTKWIDESMGPAEDRPPRKVLEALSDPAPSEYAAQWRERAWANLKARESMPKVQNGSVVVFDHPLHFTSGVDLDTFIFVKRSTFMAGPRDGGGLYRISRWRERPHKVLSMLPEFAEEHQRNLANR